MRIGFLIPEFPGQTHSFFWREISTVEAQFGHETRILSTRMPPQPVTHDWVRAARADYLYPPDAGGAVRMLLGAVRSLPRLLADRDSRALMGSARAWALALLAIRLGQRCRDLGIDHLHVHSCADSALIAAMCNRMSGQPYSLVLHGPVADYGGHQRYKWGRAAFVFIITETLAAEMRALLPDLAGKMSVVPMGVDTENFRPAPGRPRTPGSFTWFSCARLNRVKGFDTLIAAVDLLQREHPDLGLRVVIAGEDEQGGSGYRKTLEAEIDRRGLAETVTLLGAIPQERVLENLHDSDGFVLASRHEPLGVAYMEAMSCGLPTIGTDAGGVRELIEEGRSGLIVPPDDPQALAEAMALVMRSPERRAALGRGARERIVVSFGAIRSARALSEAVDRTADQD